jgi:hypothetical protein
LVQIYFSRNLGRNVEIQTDDLSYLFRALLDIARHVPSSLPAGIYNFNYYTLKSVTENICKNLTDQKKKGTSVKGSLKDIKNV